MPCAKYVHVPFTCKIEIDHLTCGTLRVSDLQGYRGVLEDWLPEIVHKQDCCMTW